METAQIFFGVIYGIILAIILLEVGWVIKEEIKDRLRKRRLHRIWLNRIHDEIDIGLHDLKDKFEDGYDE